MTSSTTERETTHQIFCPQLPLAVYREVAAHLRQVAGVHTSLIMRSLKPDPQEQFDYYQSQVAALAITYDGNFATADKSKVETILDYYAQRYAPWSVVAEK
ncbi:MAG: hypothetical protein AAFQ41_10360 [Cyanobacteria bacterium J06623_7]